MLAHGLDPVQTQRVQHGRRALHDDQHGDREGEPSAGKKEMSVIVTLFVTGSVMNSRNSTLKKDRGIGERRAKGKERMAGLHGEKDKDADDAQSAAEAKGVGERHAPQHDRQPLVGEREGPETEVGRGVRDAVEAEF